MDKKGKKAHWFKKEYKELRVSPSPMTTDIYTYWSMLISSVIKNTAGEFLRDNKNILTY